MELNLPQVASYASAVTDAPPMTAYQAIVAAKIDGASHVRVSERPESVRIIATFDSHTRTVEITPEGAFIKIENLVRNNGVCGSIATSPRAVVGLTSEALPIPTLYPL